MHNGKVVRNLSAYFQIPYGGDQMYLSFMQLPPKKLLDQVRVVTRLESLLVCLQYQYLRYFPF
jgi:hypothetical protein